MYNRKDVPRMFHLYNYVPCTYIYRSNYMYRSDEPDVQKMYGGGWWVNMEDSCTGRCTKDVRRRRPDVRPGPCSCTKDVRKKANGDG